MTAWSFPDAHTRTYRCHRCGHLLGSMVEPAYVDVTRFETYDDALAAINRAEGVAKQRAKDSLEEMCAKHEAVCGG